jgi:uncharacterized protein YjbI with pentapeptide repeats
METIFKHHFDKNNHPHNTLKKAEYDQCTFTGCTLNSIAGSRFIDCTFEACNLSLCDVTGTSLQGVHFNNCTMPGLRIDTCDAFGFSVHLHHCQLTNSVFYDRKISKTKFHHCQLMECDFTDADLSQAVFDDCDLAGAIFDNTNLEKADLRGARNYSIDPTRNKVKKAHFSLPYVVGLLDKFQIHIDK